MKRKLITTPSQDYGNVVHHKGIGYTSYNSLSLHESAIHTWKPIHVKIGFTLLALFIFGLILDWHTTLVFLIALLTFLYFADLIFNFFVICRSFQFQPEIEVTQKQINAVLPHTWPTYTIFCPLYHEHSVLHQLIKAIQKIDYPKKRLQVLLVVEEDDKKTRKHIKSMQLPSYFRVLRVPDTLPKTKPKALNFALKYAHGEFATIYDAEDIPDPLQLKKAVIAFWQNDLSLVCLQAKLNFYNTHQNILTRLFSCEYALWFDSLLPGLQSIHAPIPLGGTSNHFRIADLKKCKGWDAFNVTEDCDLGIRFARYGYHTAILDSTTYEEANSKLTSWFSQRTRWIKGYIQTYLVHMRDPRALLRDFRKPHILTFQLIVGGKVMSTFINPLMWILTISYFLLRSFIGTFVESFFPSPIYYLAAFSLVFGNFLYMYSYMIGCAKRGQEDLIKYVYLVPFYWIAMSISAWKAVTQIVSNPYYWAKTYHGLHLVIKRKRKDTPYYGRIIIRPTFSFPSWIKNIRIDTVLKSIPTTVSHASFLVVAMMVSNVLNFGFNAYLGRILTFESFGLVTLVSTLFYLLCVPVSALNATFAHRISYLSAKIGTRAGNRFYLSKKGFILNISLLVTLIWLLLIPFTSAFFKMESQLPFILFSPIIIFGIVSALMKGYLQGKFQFKILGIVLISESAGKLLFAVFLTQLHVTSLAYIAIPLSVMLSYLMAKSFMTRMQIESHSRISYEFPKRFFWAALVTGLSSSVFLSLDVLLVNHFMSPSLAGEYALLSLAGKMVYFFGSLPNIFIIPLIGHEQGLGKKSIRSFYKLFSTVSLLVFFMFLIVGPLGGIFVPIFFGEKTIHILPYLISYTGAVSLFTLTNSLVIYHLSRQQYIFSYLPLVMAVFMGIGIGLSHQNIYEVIWVLVAISVLNLLFTFFMHKLYREGTFILRNIVDLIDVFFPLPGKAGDIAGRKILIFNWRDLRHVYAGGAEVYIHELAKRWVASGNSVTFFCGNDGKSLRSEVIDGVQIYRRGGFYLVYVWAFLYYIFQFRGKCDVIIDCQNGIPFFTPLYAKEQVYGLMHHVHQEVFRKSLSLPLAMLARFLERKMMPYVYKDTRFIAVSESTRDEMVKLGLGRAGIEIVHSGIDARVFRPGKKAKQPIVLYLGRLKYYKSLHVFILSASRIIEKYPDVQFVIAGDGEEREKLSQLTKQLNLESNITFLGKVSQEEKRDLMQKAWVFVNPSFMEGWGITVLEANACGTPVVASDVPGLRDSVRNPHVGYLVDYADVNGFSKKIMRIITHTDLREKMSFSAVQWARQFKWNQSAQKSLKILTKGTRENSY